MSDIRQARKALVARILDGVGTTSSVQRRAVFENTSPAEPLGALIDTLTKRAYEITDDDIAAAKASGLSEDAVFEIVICAAVGEATRQVETALAALEAATKKG